MVKIQFDRRVGTMIKKKSKYLIMAMLVVILGFCFTTKTVNAKSVGKVTNVKGFFHYKKVQDNNGCKFKKDIG